MLSPDLLTDEELAAIIRLAPLVSIDLIIRDPLGKVLVGLRMNEPAKGFYFVPGGRIRKGETFGRAFARILQGETGCFAKIEQARFRGVYQHMYSNNRYQDPGYGTHYVVLAYELELSHRPAIAMDAQHTSFEWMDEERLKQDATVHELTRAYFMN